MPQMNGICFKPWSVTRRPRVSTLSESHQGVPVVAVSAGPKLSASLLFWLRLKEDCCEQGVCGEYGLLGGGESKGHGERPCLCTLPWAGQPQSFAVQRVAGHPPWEGRPQVNRASWLGR